MAATAGAVHVVHQLLASGEAAAARQFAEGAGALGHTLHQVLFGIYGLCQAACTAEQEKCGVLD